MFGHPYTGPNEGYNQALKGDEMPELPEVETVRRGLVPAMEGRVIERADVNRPDLRWPFPENMAEHLSGKTVLRLGRRSKYILVDLDSAETLIIHLGMSGRMQVSGINLGGFYYDHPAPAKHDHVVFHMQNGVRVTFNDPRRFGAMDLAPTAAIEDHKLISAIGPEPFGNEFDEDYFVTAVRNRRSPIKSVLLDQKVVAGLGNIYVCEVLHRAGISPKRLGSQLSAKRIASMVPIIRDVLSDAIDAGGSSLKDFRQADGELGYFQHNFQAYDRVNLACLKSDCEGFIDRITQSGRSTFYCPQCQR